MAGQDPTPSTADSLTLATLYLCNVSYAPDITTIPGLVQKTPALTPGGVWTTLWGPAQSGDQSNLAFVAAYFPQPGRAPQSICVTIRGTNIVLGEDIWGIISQIWQDLDATSQVPLPWTPPGIGGRIAQGTSDGLTIIRGLTSRGQSLGDYLRGFFATPSNANIASVVTGHSLGGCLASVLAPWMESIRGATYKGVIQPITFAAPTAGDADFADYYSALLPTARRFQNTLDIIPLAFENLPKIPDIYSRDGLDPPNIVLGAILGWQFLLDRFGATYKQPARGAQLLPGVFVPRDAHDWFAQALDQHSLVMYRSLLTGEPIDEFALPQSTTPLGTQAGLAKRMGNIEDALKRVAPPHAAE